MAREPNTPNDPDRREKIVAATMELLRAKGIRAITARAVSSRAHVPSSSVSYHFPSVHALLLEALERVLALRRTSLRQWASALTTENVHFQLADLVHRQLSDDRDLTVLSYELQILGLRDREFALRSDGFMDELRRELEPHCGANEARRLVATTDGIQMQALLNEEPPTRAGILAMIADR